VLLSKETRELVAVEVTDLGEHRLKDFAEPVWIFQLGGERFPPLKTISNTNLPRPASSFVGRTQEVEEVTSELRDGARLLTLTGPGGSGKTRLAIEAAAELVPQFPHGVFWVGLASLRDAALVTETVAQTVGAKDGIARHIGEREMLLVLDNFEQVVEAAPGLPDLLEACPSLRLLVTSRELLRVRGEVEYAVPPLAGYEAVALFCTRSGLEPEGTIEELCRRLDNLPLALELAAARTSVLSPAQILERLSTRLDLLKGGRDAEARQQTLRATIEWSYDLLSEDEQALFARLSVFAGGCTLQAAEKVAWAELDVLQSLVDKSLLRHTEERFWMLETIRDYAVERLEVSGNAEQLGRRHAEYFLAFADEVEPLQREECKQWLDQLEREHDNIRAALDRFQASGETQLALRLAAAVWVFWRDRAHMTEGWRRLESALSADERPTAARAKALNGASLLAVFRGDAATGRLRAEEALAIYRQLMVQRPGDAGLQERIAVLERELRPSLPMSSFAESADATSGAAIRRDRPAVTIRSFFAAIAARRTPSTRTPTTTGHGGANTEPRADSGEKPAPAGGFSQLFDGRSVARGDDEAAAALAGAFSEEFSPAPAQMPGEPAHAAPDELSLDDVFGSGSAHGEQGRASQGVSFDQFFAEESGARGADERGDGRESQDGSQQGGSSDLELFHAWLEGLKK
jgi:predicted ATPase